ncbi:MAG: tetrahydrofolylpolyglutamate synthase/dihydrofolate synthase [Dethiosulfovibrio peptidovorans]|nr:MAG: tetrahydrofolylpolyglutamate synthase/dihydrofolate synthase [Dethiosulfovibrio peptidovorans]
MTVSSFAGPYEAVEALLNDLSSPVINPGLERVSRLLDLLDHPEGRFSSIHVVGTNGKGSTSAMMTSALREAGYRTALYSSPHLVSFGERLLVDGAPLPPNCWMQALKRVEERLQRDHVLSLDRPTYFEVLTTAAILLIAESEVDVAVVEAGMGGRLDATNVLSNVIVSVVSPIAMDHCEFLGDSLEAVAGEKFAVVRDKTAAVYAGDGGGPLSRLFVDVCRARGAQGIVVDQDVSVENLTVGLSGTSCVLRRGDRDTPVSLGLIGAHQGRNAALAYEACLTLKDRFPLLEEEAILHGFKATQWPGRLQVVSQRPPILVDGAHNPHGMEALAENLPRLFGRERLVVVYASMADKDYRKTLEILSRSIACRLICTQVPGNDRCASAEVLYWIAASLPWTGPPIAVSHPDCALELALRRGDVVLCCGSLYLVGWILAHMQE